MNNISYRKHIGLAVTLGKNPNKNTFTAKKGSDDGLKITMYILYYLCVE